MDEARKPVDGLETIAKKAAEGAHFEFNPAAWDAMEKKLDAPTVHSSKWWKIIGPGILLVILSLTNFWPIERAMVNSGKVTQGELTKEGSNGINSVDQKSEEAKVTQENQTLENDEMTSVVIEVESKTGYEKPIEISTSKRTQQTVSYFESSQERKRSDEKLFSNTSQPNERSSGMVNQEAELDEFGIEKIFIEWIPIDYRFDLDLGPLETTKSEIPTEDSLQQFKRWTFGVLVSMDLSSTGLDGFTKPGTMIGAFAEYRVAKDWGILTGVSYAIKKYSALGSEYETPYWITARPDDLLAINANCIVIDIPLNLKKYFKTKKGKDWFISSGVSSYLMLREDYTYEYSEQKPNWLPTWSVKNQNNHYLGIANLSAGYETSISKTLALSIEPFFKLPLTGIGQGKVKFLSFGTNLAIKLK